MLVVHPSACLGTVAGMPVTKVLNDYFVDQKRSGFD